MSQYAVADSIREALLASLRNLGALIETMNELAARSAETSVRGVFERLGQAGREVYLVRGVGLVNIHVRGKAPGWWNILKSVKDDLDYMHSHGVKSFYVFLVGRNDRFVADGYIATDFASPPFSRPPGVEVTKYTVNEKQHLDQSKKLLSIDKIAKTLLAAQSPSVGGSQ
jgi:hypothetical protein